MPARAVNTDEDAQVDAEPLRIRGSTISTLVVARQTANLENDTLHIVRQRDKDKKHACMHVYIHVHALSTQKSSNHCTTTMHGCIVHTYRHTVRIPPGNDPFLFSSFYMVPAIQKV